MGSRDLAQIVIMGLILLCGYVFLLQFFMKRAVNKSMGPIIAIFLLVIYGLLSVILVMVLSSLGSMDMAVTGLLILLACMVLLAAIIGLFRNFHAVRKGYLVLFVLYLTGVGYITLFSRETGSNGGIIQMVPFASLTERRTAHVDMLNHMMLNVALFVMMGILFPAILPEKLSKWSYVLGIGLMGTILIETMQLIFRLGQFDIDDIIANTLGALLGYLFYGVYRRITRNQRDGDTET